MPGQINPDSLTTALVTPQVSDVPATQVSTDAATGLFVVPFIADLSVDASGSVGVLQQVSVTMTQIDRILNVTLPDADAVKLLKAFQISDVAYGQGQSKVADVTVSMKEKALFVEALTKAIAEKEMNAVDMEFVDGAAVRGMYGYLLKESRQDTLDMLGYDSLANLLEASDLLSFDIALDASGGADNMYNTMNAGAAAYRAALFKQLTESRIESYMLDASGLAHTGVPAEAVTQLDFLPVWNGDKLVFVFDVTVGEVTSKPAGAAWGAANSGAKITRTFQDGTSATNSTAGAGNLAGGASAVDFSNNASYADAGAQLIFTAPTKRRVALQVQCGNGVPGATFTHGRVGGLVALA
jgi:hypothetical protein